MRIRSKQICKYVCDIMYVLDRGRDTPLEIWYSKADVDFLILELLPLDIKIIPVRTNLPGND